MQTYFKSNHSSNSFRKFFNFQPVSPSQGGFSIFNSRKGFTALEFAIVITIATIITTSLIIQHNRWNDHLAVKTQAYELSLMIRQAQIWSLGVREDVAGSNSNRFNVGYGVRVDSITSSNKNLLFFVDRDGNQKLNVNSQNEEIVSESKPLTRGVFVEKVCGIRNGTETCSPLNNLDKLDITFLRPNPKATMKFLRNQACGGSGSCTDANGFSPPATIYLSSPQGNESVVTIEANGQISVQ